MSSQPDEPDPQTDDRSKAEIEADLHDTREHLAESVDALTDRLDVKTRGQQKAAQLKEERGQEIAIGAAVAAVLIVGVLVWRKRRS